MAKPFEETLGEIVTQKKKVQEEIKVLADGELADLMADKSGLLEVTLRESRNVVPPVVVESEDGSMVDNDNNEAYETPVKFVVSIKPATVVVEEGAFTEFEFTELPGKATFQVSSLEAKVVVHFGRTLEHHVSIVLTNATKENELERLSDWHASTGGEETETPQVQDVSDVPALRLHFSFKRANRDEIATCTDQLKQLQNELVELSKKEKGLKAGPQQLVPSAPSSTALAIRDGGEDAGDEKPKRCRREGRWGGLYTTV